MHFLSCAPLGASLLLLAALPAHADDRDDQNREAIVVTAERLADEAEAAIRRTPGGADVVTAEDFENTLAVSLRDALAFSPGIYAQPRYGQEIRLSIRGSGIGRGFHVRGLMLFQDGVPINLADNSGDFQELDPQVFERIDVLRGADALRLGGSTLGGAINAITPTGRTAPGIETRIDGGSFETLRGKVAAGFADARGDAYLALTHDRSNGDREHADRRSTRLNANMGIRLGDRVETRFYATISDIDQKLPGTLTRAQALDDPRQALPALILGDQARDVHSIRVQNRTTLDLGRGSVSGGVFANAKQLYHPIFQVIDQKSFDYGAFARLDLAGDVAGMPVDLALGSTARLGSVNARQFVNVAGRRGAVTARARQEAHTIDSYGEVRVQPVPALSLVAGAVHSHGRRSVDNFLNGARSGSASFDLFSPKLGLLVTTGNGIQFFANASRSVELPGFGDLNQTPFAVGGVVTPGFVDLDVQRAWTIEAGTRGTLGAVRWDITAYRADIRGELLQFNQAPDIPAATFNADRTRHQGLEAGLDIDLTEWLRLRQAYQHNDFTFRGDAQFGDNRLPVVPEHLYRAELTLGTDRASVSPVVEWVPRGAFADYTNSTRVPAYALLGLRAQAALREGLTLFLDARNLTGNKAIGDVSAVVTATPASAIYYPVERRGIYGGARVRF
ncbi:TonB-dependent receptor family protein [Sphingomonas baiyangensis]|uniref:TonB-dependent receptor n=1 Tax=Sphingomonas baiyangensis TaxID=2572576 RepID=A0A4U1L434_9SPHN|nr:TonB-dependent receptor [Sphingomonas baiyangensis]TKD51502.1 TonB-dependent receptor [Sphingomonas baiyangensis]